MAKFNTQPHAGYRIRTLFAVVLALVLVGCSTIRLTYNNGDTLLHWWIDSYVDLDSSQSDAVKRDIDQMFVWHRRTQLPDYIALLQRGKQQLARGVTMQDLSGLLDEVRVRGERLTLHAVPQLADLARTLKPDQLEQLEKKFDKNNRDYRRKFMSRDPEQRQKARYRRSMDQLKLWFGRFSNEQEDAIRRLSDARPQDYELWLQERQRRQRTILDLVRRVQAQRLDKAATEKLIAAAIRDNFARLQTPERKAANEAQTRFYHEVIKLTTPEQREHAQKRMQGWINEFRQLSAEKQT